MLRSEEVQAMVEKLEKEEEKLKKTENTIAVMTMLKDGTVPETISTSGESQGDAVTLSFHKKLNNLLSLLFHYFYVLGVSDNSKVEELEDRINQLEAARDELVLSVEKLTKEKEALEETLSEQSESNKELTEKNSELEEKVNDLEKENETLRNELDEIGEGGSVPTPAFSSDGQDVEVMHNTFLLLIYIQIFQD